MKSLRSIIEAVDIRMYIDKYGKISRSDLVEKYLDEFWKILGEYCTGHGGFISRNGYRIYIPIPKNFTTPVGEPPSLGASGDEFTTGNRIHLHFQEADLEKVLDVLSPEDNKISRNIFDIEFFENICRCVEKSLIAKKINSCGIEFLTNLLSYRDNYGRIKTIKLSKLIGDPDVLQGYGKLLTFISTPKNHMLLCFSNHKYDIVGMSTDRKWTSCMNAYSGSYNSYLKKDIEEGMFVGYIISDKDTNIEDPFGRIYILPATTASNRVVYVPAPKVYSPFNGMSKVRDFIINIFQDIYDVYSELTVDPLLYSDGMPKAILKTRGKYRGFDISNLPTLPLPTKRGQVAYYKIVNDIMYGADFSGRIRKAEDLYAYVLCAILIGAIFIYDHKWEVIPCGRKDFYKIFSETFEDFKRYQRDIERFISDNTLYNMWKFETESDATEYIRRYLNHFDLKNLDFKNVIISIMNSELRDSNGLEEEYTYDLIDKIRVSMEFNDIFYSITILSSGMVESDDGQKYAICQDNFIAAWEGTYSDKVLKNFLNQYIKNGGIIKYKTRNEAERGTGLPASW